MNDYYDIEHVKGAISLLEKENNPLVQRLDIPEKIVQRLSKHTRSEWINGSLEDFRQCWFNDNDLA